MLEFQRKKYRDHKQKVHIWKIRQNNNQVRYKLI